MNKTDEIIETLDEVVEHLRLLIRAQYLSNQVTVTTDPLPARSKSAMRRKSQRASGSEA